MAEDDYDMIFKIVLIGDSGVGKSNILSRYIKNEFNFDTKATVGVEFATKKYEIKNRKIKAQIWDTAGQERYRSITSSYYKGAKGAFVVYDITRRGSFDTADKWILDLKANVSQDVTIILLGNKSDCEDKRNITIEEGQNKAKEHSIYYQLLRY
jgi:small GTP-binding protein